MEKEAQQDSLSTVTVKPDYAPSEVYSTEPPPAYHKPKSSSVQVAKIAAATVIVCSVVLGCFWLASSYVQATATCRQLEQELELLEEAADRFQPVQPQALVQEEPAQNKRHVESQEKDKKNVKEVEDNTIDDSSSDGSSDSSSSSESEDDDMPGNMKIPLHMALNHLEEALADRNQKSRMNCIVEKKKAEEIVDHQPKHIRLPFGVNLTTDPRYERLSGERMVIICESGTIQRAQPQEPETDESDSSSDEDSDSGEDTIMIQPVMIPIPHTAFQTHMPVVQQQAPSQQLRPVQPIEFRPAPSHQIEGMRPPMPPAIMHIQIQPQLQQQPQQRPQESDSQQKSDMPPNPIIQHIIQQIITQKIMEGQRMRQEQMRQDQMRQESMRQEAMRQEAMRQESMRQEAMKQEQMRHDMMRMIAMRQEAMRQEAMRQEAMRQEQMRQNQMRQQDDDREEAPEGAVRRIPIPEEVLTQLNRLPNADRVIVAVSEPETTSSSSSEEDTPAPQEVRVAPQGQQVYGRAMQVPVNVQQQEQSPQEPEAQADENRPQYAHPVQPRSIPVAAAA